MPTTKLPQLERMFLTDAGLETDMIFSRGIDLPHFASIMLLRSREGARELEDYFRGFLELASKLQCGFILESATWRASPDWSEPLHLSHDELDALNRAAIDLLLRLREGYRSLIPAIVVSGCIGPRGDGYDAGKIMSPEEARTYHSHQAGVLASAGADMLTAITMTNVPEAIGVTNAARELGVPVAISFTVETDGTLPTGDALADAVGSVDQATDAYPAYFMINCAHPTHFASVLEKGTSWTKRIGGVRANASRCSHAELDSMTELDIGDPAELGELHRQIRNRFRHINVLGGCCGTDLRHVTAIAEACL